MDSENIKLEILKLLRVSSNQEVLLQILEILKEEDSVKGEQQAQESVPDSEDLLCQTSKGKELYGTNEAAFSTLSEKEKGLKRAFEEGEKSGIIENLNLEVFLEELHRKYL